MRGSPRVVEQLNTLLTIELTAINQYFMHAKLAEHWGFERTAKRFRDDSIEEMKDAESLMDRILSLEGLPNLQRLDDFSVGETVPEQLGLALSLEERAVAQLHEAIAVCENENDPGTAEILSDMLLEEQEQVEWLAAQVALVSQLGEQLYLSQQIRD
jgi:bacterioferritin